MSNSQVFIDSVPDPEGRAPQLRAEESRLLRIVEALRIVQDSKEWSTLKTEVFDNLANVLEKDLRTEAEKTDLSSNKLNRITGELKWARRYANLNKFENEKRVELQNVRQQLYGKKSE